MMADASPAPETGPDKGAEDGKKSGAGGLVGLTLLGVTAASSAFALVYMLAPSIPASTVAACSPETTITQTETAAFIPDDSQAYVAMDEILITIGSAPAERYVRMDLSVITDEDHVETVEGAKALLIDSFTRYLRVLELSDFENPDFYAEMRDQLARRAELVLGGDAVRGVLITEFLLR